MTDFGVQHPLDADGLEILRDDGWLEGLDDFDRAPLGVGECGRAPPGLLAASVVGFAVVDLGFQDRRDVSLPALVGRNPVDGAVGIFDAQLRLERGRRVAVVIRLLQPLQRRGVPSRRKIRADRVASCLEIGGDVVGLIGDAAAIVGPARRKNLIADGGGR